MLVLLILLLHSISQENFANLFSLYNTICSLFGDITLISKPFLSRSQKVIKNKVTYVDRMRK